MPPDDIAPVGFIEVRSGPATITGRSLPQLFLRRESGVFTPVTGGPYPVELISQDAGAGTAVIRRQAVSQALKWRVTPLGPGGVMRQIIFYGQSLAGGKVDNGFDKIPSFRDFVHERAHQFKPADGIPRGCRILRGGWDRLNRHKLFNPLDLQNLEPLRGALYEEREEYSQTAAESCTLALLGQHLHQRDHVLACAIGTGSTAIIDLAQGSPHFRNAQAAIAAGRAQALARGLAHEVTIVWIHGEYDNTIGTTLPVYKASWLTATNAFRTYVAEIGSAFGSVVIVQTLQRPSGTTGMATLAQADLIAAGEALAVMPQTCLPGYSGGTHLQTSTYLPLGCAIAYEISRMIAGGSPTVPHVAAGGAVLTTGTQINCTISGGNGTFAFDTTTIPADIAGTYGVRVAHTGGTVPVTISSMSFTGANVLQLNLGSSIVIGSGPDVSFGLFGPAGMTGGGASRLNLRDTSAWPCACTGQVASGWMMHHTAAVVVV